MVAPHIAPSLESTLAPKYAAHCGAVAPNTLPPGFGNVGVLFVVVHRALASDTCNTRIVAAARSNRIGLGLFLSPRRNRSRMSLMPGARHPSPRSPQTWPHQIWRPD